MTQLEKFFKNLKASFFASAAIYLVTGMLLMIFPEQIAKVACYLFGGLFVKFFSCRSVSSLFSITLVSGIIIAAIGIFLMFKQDVVYSVIPFIFGIVAIIDGLINIQRAVMLARNHFPMWWLSLLFAVVAIVLGLIMAIRPFETAMFAFRFIGICFVFNGVMDMWGTYSFNKFVKDTKDDYVIEAKTEEKNGENK